MEELMKSFGLFADEDGYWFVTKEDQMFCKLFKTQKLQVTLLMLMLMLLSAEISLLK